MVATCMKKIKRAMLYDMTVVYVRDIANVINVILPLNVNCLSVCSSYLRYISYHQ